MAKESWEYKVCRMHVVPGADFEAFEAELASVGAEGWELIGIHPLGVHSHHAVYIFKRPIISGELKSTTTRGVDRGRKVGG